MQDLVRRPEFGPPTCVRPLARAPRQERAANPGAPEMLRAAMPDRHTNGRVEDRAYQRSFFPLVPCSHNLIAGLLGGILGALYVVITGHGEYFDALG
jgi:hypothetical protein